MQCRWVIEEFIFTPVILQNNKANTEDSKKRGKREGAIGKRGTSTVLHFIYSRRITREVQTTPIFSNKVLNLKVEVSSKIVCPIYNRRPKTLFLFAPLCGSLIFYSIALTFTNRCFLVMVSDAE